jgi:hypothetical protein
MDNIKITHQEVKINIIKNNGLIEVAEGKIEVEEPEVDMKTEEDNEVGTVVMITAEDEVGMSKVEEAEDTSEVEDKEAVVASEEDIEEILVAQVVKTQIQKSKKFLTEETKMSISNHHSLNLLQNGNLSQKKTVHLLPMVLVSKKKKQENLDIKRQKITMIKINQIKLKKKL